MRVPLHADVRVFRITIHELPSGRASNDAHVFYVITLQNLYVRPICLLSAPCRAAHRVRKQRTPKMFKIKLEPSDFHLAVRRRKHRVAPWRWEIWAAAQTKAVEQSKCHYATMTRRAIRDGKAALKTLLRKRFSDAA
jgi:hypothetical protein